MNKLILMAILIGAATPSFAQAAEIQNACDVKVSQVGKAFYNSTSPMKWPVDSNVQLTESFSDKHGIEYKSYTVGLHVTNGLRIAIMPLQVVVFGNCEIAEIKTMYAPQK